MVATVIADQTEQVTRMAGQQRVTLCRVKLAHQVTGHLRPLLDPRGLADLVPQAQRGTAYGWFNGAVGLTALPASLLAGLLWQGIGDWGGLGMRAPFLLGALLALLAAAVFSIQFPKQVGNPT